MTHGRKSTYDRHKCRCDECRAANAAYMQQYRNDKYANKKRKQGK